MSYEWDLEDPAINSVVEQGKADSLEGAKDAVIEAAQKYDKKHGGVELMMYVNDGKQVIRTEWPDTDAWEVTA